MSSGVLGPVGRVILTVLVVAAVWLTAAREGPGAVWAASGGEAPDDAERIRETFERGNNLYEQGDYDSAINVYEELLASGVADEDLFYNLGNSYYKTDQLGRAVLFYERALRLSPRDQDVRENLDLVRSQLKDRQFVRDQNRLVGAVVWLHHRLNRREMFAITSLTYLLMCILGIAFVFRDSRPVSAVYRTVSVLSPGRLAGLSKSQDLLAAIIVTGCVFLTTGVSSFHKIKQESARSHAVVLEGEIPVFSSPTEDATLQFRIHEGTTVVVRQQRNQWVRVDLPGGLSGWVSAGAVERI